ncbi:MAG: hypothetical protein ABR532_03885 [Candidatus Dormibacteria bacterium]
MSVMVRSHRIDYRSPSWRFHRRVSFTFWYLAGAVVAAGQIRGMEHGTWPVRNGLVGLGCVAVLLFPYRVQAGHLFTYKHMTWALLPVAIPVNAFLYVAGVMPQIRPVNWTEMFLRHVFGFRSELPGSLIALAAVGLAPMWLMLLAGRAAGL